MSKKCKVAIIGAGTAGLSAFKEVIKHTKEAFLIDRGPLGTTCARIGCMPSKIFIRAANAFYSRNTFSTLGISGGDMITADIPRVLQRVRALRDQFTNGVVKYTESLKDHLIIGEASFVDPQTLRVNNELIHAENIIIATGSSNVIPTPWRSWGSLEESPKPAGF